VFERLNRNSLALRVRRFVGDVLSALPVGLHAVGLVLGIRLQDLLLLLEQLLRNSFIRF